MLKNWGFQALAKHEYKESLEEMKHADKLIERILFLDGLPNLQELGRLKIGETIPEVLAGNLSLEQVAHADLVEGITLCEKHADYVSRALLADILEETEDHIDFLETQIELLDKLGEANYLQSATGEMED
jgi:bacterioferritin